MSRFIGLLIMLGLMIEKQITTYTRTSQANKNQIRYNPLPNLQMKIEPLDKEYLAKEGLIRTQEKFNF